jgi:hypothetical protein
MSDPADAAGRTHGGRAPGGSVEPACAPLRAERRFRPMASPPSPRARLFVGLLFASIISTGWTAFVQTYVALDIEYSTEEIDPPESPSREDLRRPTTRR